MYSSNAAWILRAKKQTAATVATAVFAFYYLKRKANRCTEKWGRWRALKSAEIRLRYLLEISHDRTHAVAITHAFYDFAVAIHLAKFSVRVARIIAVDHEVVHDQADTRPDTEAIFR
jgi:hypothetical protein